MAGCQVTRGLQQMNTMEVAVVLGRLVNSLLGSNNSLKCVVDEDGSTVTVCDAVDLLKHLDIEHPVGQLVLSACQSHQDSHVTGSKTLLVLIGIWMKSAIRLREQGVPLTDILHLMHAGIDVILSHLEELKIPVAITPNDEEMLYCDKMEDEKLSRETNSLSLEETFNVTKVEWHRPHSDKTEKKELHTANVIGGKLLGSSELQPAPSAFDISHDRSKHTWKRDEGNPVSTFSETCKAPEPDPDFQRSHLPTSPVDDVHLFTQKTEPHFSSLADYDDSDDDFADCFEGISPTDDDFADCFEGISPTVPYLACSAKQTDIILKLKSENEKEGLEKFLAEHMQQPSNCVPPVFHRFEGDETEVIPLTLKMSGISDLDDISDDVSWYFEPDLGIGQTKSQSELLLHPKIYETVKISPKNVKNLAKESNGLSIDSTAFGVKMSTEKKDFLNSPNTLEGHGICSSRSFGLDFENCEAVASSPNTSEAANGKDEAYLRESQKPVENETLETENEQKRKKLEELLSKVPSVSLSKLKNCSRHFKTIESTLETQQCLTSSQAEHVQNSKGNNCDKVSDDQSSLPLVGKVDQTSNKSDAKNSTDNLTKIKTESVLEGRWSSFKRNLVRNSRHCSRHLKTSDNLTSPKPNELADIVNTEPHESGHLPSDKTVQRKTATDITVQNLQTVSEDCCLNPFENQQGERVMSLETLAHGLSHGCDFPMRLVMEVFHRQNSVRQNRNDGGQQPQLELGRLHTCVTGPGAERSSCVVGGVVLGVPPQAHPMVQSDKDKPTVVNALLVNGNLSSNSKHTGYKTPLKTLTTFSKPGSKRRDSWMERVLRRVLDLGIRVLLVKGSVDADLKLSLESHDIVVTENVRYKLLAVLAGSDMSRLVTYVESCSEEDLCPLKVSNLSLEDKNLGHLLVLTPNADTTEGLWTILLSHPSDEEAHRREQQVWKCATRLSSALEAGFVVPGNGQSELRLANRLSHCDDHPSNTERLSSNSNVFQSLVFAELAQGLREYHSLVVRNTACESDTRETLSTYCRCLDYQGIQDRNLNLKPPSHKIECMEDQKSNFVGIINDCSFGGQRAHSSGKEYTEACEDHLTGRNYMKGANDHMGKESIKGQKFSCILDSCLKTECPKDNINLCLACGLPKPPVQSRIRPCFDDLHSKAAAYRTAVDTICLILQCDYHITTGVSQNYSNLGIIL